MVVSVGYFVPEKKPGVSWILKLFPGFPPAKWRNVSRAGGGMQDR